MQFKRLKKNYRKQTIIGGLILVCITSAITITTTRAKYKLIQDIPLVRGSINYKSYDFKVMAMYKSEDKINYTEIDEMPSEGYNINEEKSYCNESNGNKDTTAVLKTINGNHTIGKLKKNDRCYLYFDKSSDITISDIILANNPKETVPDFSQIATADEGMFKTSDGMYGGYSYYWRGAVTNNYVKFGKHSNNIPDVYQGNPSTENTNFLEYDSLSSCQNSSIYNVNCKLVSKSNKDIYWRIIRINGDGSLRLIYDGSKGHINGENTSDSIAIANMQYNKEYYDRAEGVGYTYTLNSQRADATATTSTIKSSLDKWYNENLLNYDNKIATGKFCNDREVATESNWHSQPNSTFYYAGHSRLVKRKIPTLSCSDSGDIYSLKIGTITADEVGFAGGVFNTNNLSYYLNNNHNYWTMSPYYVYYYDSLKVNRSDVFRVTINGVLAGNHSTNNGVGFSYSGIRPVINLKADTQFQAGGTGTLDNPYVVV